jgi:transposase
MSAPASKRWFFWSTHARFLTIGEVVYALKAHLDNIMTYCRHRVTNAWLKAYTAKW